VGPRAVMDDVEEEKILDPAGTRIPTPWSSSPYLVAIPTTLSRLQGQDRYSLKWRSMKTASFRQ
jgi:hypothetical protein